MILQFTWSSIADEDDNHQTTITCKATKKTWANQRRKRRLAAQHQQTVAKKSKEESEKQPEGACRQDNNVSISTTPLVDSCHLEFTCSAFHDGVNTVQFKYLLGDSKDDLHQVIQYLKNQLTQSYKQEQHTMHQQHHKQQQ